MGRHTDTTKNLEGQDYWVAKILEVRASDRYHVYARVYWMYSPDDLPRKALHGDSLVRGSNFHFQNELVASNHMDIINVVSIVEKATVHHHCEEQNGHKAQNMLFWRQAYDYLTSEISLRSTPIPLKAVPRGA
ncbi:ebs-bah-phd domain-containing protein [Metarhizium guizhouense ARSEF 977]|uniref:Ebs-bah-phd domain-containing protein n=1 Tax=Metarhizium guizhouense (strain ARSEF 977) TaxID=1276136 RepID=A0A0B4GQA5_METGA|nr:ebs-bah-phd domain-containing protein [Metarhizium guizhouense ARSEF 977]